MSNSKSEIINKRILKLADEDFDLDAWKEATVAALQRILSIDDPILKQIDQLKVDYGSWALRDATSKYNPVETAKKKGQQLLEGLLENYDSFDLKTILKLHFEESFIKKIVETQDRNQLTELLKKEKKDNLAAALASFIKQNQ